MFNTKNMSPKGPILSEEMLKGQFYHHVYGLSEGLTALFSLKICFICSFPTTTQPILRKIIKTEKFTFFHIFWQSVGYSGGICNSNLRKNIKYDHHGSYMLHAKFGPNPFSSFGEDYGHLE